MGGIFRKLLRHVVEATIVFLLIVFLPGLPPPFEFSELRVTPPMPLEGPLAVNGDLNRGEHLFEGKIKGPESLEVYKGEIYSGIHGGEIVKFVNDEVVPVVKFGKPCGGFIEEAVCGRPLGLKFDSKGYLFVADAYYGIFQVDVNKRAFTQLVSMDEPINGKKAKFPNGIDVASDGMVYWSDSSAVVDLQNGGFSVFGDRSGRLLRYNPKTKQNEVLVDNLYLANGVSLSSEENYVLVAETMASRIIRYHLKGPKKGQTDVFLDGLPGAPDNIKRTENDGFFIALTAHRAPGGFNVLEFLGMHPILQKFFARMFMLIELPFAFIDSVIPNFYTKKIVHMIGSFETVADVVPSSARIVEVDKLGNVIGSLHCTDGSLKHISEVLYHDRTYYLASPYNEYLGRVKTRIPIHIKKPASSALPGGVKGS
ncbi:adipocyte plasma membrane-associated protein-like [Ischnura elegans]|uniref:adipocyte plasma membrane-associated protein-like n=1 Tax=Ischnura elegans TaxID=197161 RepID=UPI001ED87D26|nr:adipocyte plasma membrane-associated protein-like [Ischnura elegans]XP_046401506.1 adipocyte plasma membrane-associated protein-like [Ischnura elegans]